jgi:hypothetical protein
MTAIYGAASQMGFDTANPVTVRQNFLDCGVVSRGKTEDMNLLRGTRSRSKEATRQGIQRCGGPIRTNPTAIEMQSWLPWILGTPVSGTTYALAEAIATRFLSIDRSNYLFGGTAGKVYTYSGAGINRATWKAAQGGIPLELSVEVVAQTEAVGIYSSFPVLALDIATKPWLFTDLTLTIGGTPYNCRDFELTLDNKIDTERFLNSLTLTGLYGTDRIVSLSTHVPYAGAEALYNSGGSGVSCTAVFTNGVDVLTFTLGSLVFPQGSPPGNERNETFLPVTGEAYMSGANKELVATLAVS